MFICMQGDCLSMLNKIKQAMHDTATTQQDLADIFGVSKQYINEFLTGKNASIDIELKCRDYFKID